MLTLLPCSRSRNTGALGPLLIMMQNEQDTEKLRGCLDTLAFLLLDKANRKVINEIHGLDVIMGLFSRTQDPTVLCSALDAVCSLVRSDDADKQVELPCLSRKVYLSQQSSCAQASCLPHHSELQWPVHCGLRPGVCVEPPWQGWRAGHAEQPWPRQRTPV
eukprot:scaffold9217_cov17-Tisochrysis_lutea.AAC.2